MLQIGVAKFAIPGFLEARVGSACFRQIDVFEFAELRVFGMGLFQIAAREISGLQLRIIQRNAAEFAVRQIDRRFCLLANFGRYVQ